MHVKATCTSCAGGPFLLVLLCNTYMCCAVLWSKHRLPQKRVLTLNLELPESWLVEPVMALHDLDNLRLADIPEQVRRWAGYLLFWGKGWGCVSHGGCVGRQAVLGVCLRAQGCGWGARNRHKHMTTSETWVLHPLRVAPDALMLTSS